MQEAAFFKDNESEPGAEIPSVSSLGLSVCLLWKNQKKAQNDDDDDNKNNRSQLGRCWSRGRKWVCNGSRLGAGNQESAWKSARLHVTTSPCFFSPHIDSSLAATKL